MFYEEVGIKAWGCKFLHLRDIETSMCRVWLSTTCLPNPDLEKDTVFPTCHCEHLKGACLHAQVLSIAGARQAFRHAGVAISLEKARLLRFPRLPTAGRQ